MSDVPQPQPPEPSVPSNGIHAADRPAFADVEGASPSAGRNHLPAIPGYEVLDKLGAGGMGIVYKARHLALNRLVAIKVLNRIQQATEREILRLQMEGETVANLQHPNIVPLYQMGEFAGLPFLAFEYIDGGTLADRITGRPQPPREAAEMVELLARAVQLAHQQGVLHRDLKPANVLLSKDGVPKIADFGLARRLDYHEYTTELIAGTANYMSPEQAWGDSKTNPLTPATDVYSLGAILYELLTGRPPFASESREETIKDVWNKAPAAPRSLAPNVPPDLQTICLKCLEKEPGRRYANAVELADDLRRWLNSEPIVARPTGRFERTVLWCRRDPVFAGMIAGLLVAILAGATVSSWLAKNYWEQRNEADSLVVRAIGAEDRAKWRLISANEARAEAELRQQELTGANKLLATSNDQLESQLYESLILSTARDIELKEPKELADHLRRCPPRLRGIEWQIRFRQLQDSLLARHATRHHRMAMAVSADGKWVATGATEDEKDLKAEPVRVWSTDNWQLRASLGHYGQRLAFSPDSELLVVDNPSTGVEIWNWRESRLLRRFSRAVTSPEMDKLGIPIFRPIEGEAAFSPDGRHFAIGLSETVQIYPVHEGEVKGSQTERILSTGAVTALQFYPDNRRLAVLAYLGRSKSAAYAWQAELQIWDATTGAAIRRIPLDGTFKSMCVSPDGRQAAVASDWILSPHEVRVYDLNDGQFRKFEARAELQAVRFSRDGRTLLVASRGVELVDIENLKVKSSPGSLLGTAVIDVDSLPDGRIVGAGRWDGSLKVWPRDGQSRLPHWYEGGPVDALSRDGSELAVAQQDGAIRRFDLSDNRELPRLPAQEFTEAAGSVERLPKHLEIANVCYSTTPGELLVVYSDLSARIWRLADQRVIASVGLACPAIETRPGPSPRHEPYLAHKSRFFTAGSILLSDDGKYAAWDGYLHQRTGSNSAAFMVWELRPGRIIVNENLPPDPNFPVRYPGFATIGGRIWAVLYKSQQPFRDPWRQDLPLSAGWDLVTGNRRSDPSLEQELRAARGPRVIDAIDTLTITSPVSGLVLLQLPLESIVSGAPRLSTDRSRLAVPTERGIGVFDVGPMPEFALPEDGPVRTATD